MSVRFPTVLLLACSACTFLLATNCRTSHAPVRPFQFVVLPPGLAADVLQQCSRASASFQDTRSIAAEDVEQLESDLPRLNGTRARECCLGGARLENVNDSFGNTSGS